MPIQSKLIQDLLWFSQIADKISLIRIPVEVIPRPYMVQLNQFLKIFLMPIQSKLIQDILWFSYIAAKISLIRIPIEVIPRPCLIADKISPIRIPVEVIPRLLFVPVKSIPKDFSDADPVKVNLRPALVQSDRR
ncbi:unnamed protein product [Vicia faba]|uniref:Uncharacterized protein n=1 Tax=Vicia faba TaxID=3906 RepID=A0AAV1AZ47_VICFA|nr:unnamed protein product [Vicia faba]